MKRSLDRPARSVLFFLLAICVLSALRAGPASAAAGPEASAFRLHGAGWIDFGRIMRATDTLVSGAAPSNVLDLNGNGLQSLGGQFTMEGDLGSHFEAAFGMGVYRTNHSLGRGGSRFMAISLYQNFITQSRLTYYQGERGAPWFSATLGAFPYVYNPDVKNLGLYLLRGPVYPGILMGGFQDASADSSRGSQLGARLHHAFGAFSQDLILTSEREVPPTLDWSLAYVSKFRTGPVELGAGIECYRLWAENASIRTPGHMSDAELGFRKAQYIEVDPATGDTVFFTHQGAKLMGMAALDLKKVFGISSLGAGDLRLYAEAAVIGTRNYGKAYDDVLKRIPIMAGFNFPTFGWADFLSLEAEYYGSRYRSDLVRVGNTNGVADWTTQDHPVPSPKPVDYSDYGISPQGIWVNAAGDSIDVKGTAMDMQNLRADDWKWSLNVQKTVAGHIRFSGQIANDHFRPRPVATGLIFSNYGTAEAFGSPRDWYFMVRAGYYF